MEKIGLRFFFNSLVILLFVSGYVFAQNWTWTRFKAENQPWSILAPGQMKPDAEAEDEDGPKGSYSYNDYKGFFAVIYRDSPRRLLPFKPNYNNYYKTVRDDVVRANRGELVSDIEFRNRNVTGHEVHVKFLSGTTRSVEGQVIAKYRIQRFRMFFVGRRFYVLLAVLPESDIDKPEIDNYLNSFSFNTPPVAAPDFYSLDEDTTLTVSAADGVLKNDRDAEDNPLTVSSSKPVTPTAHGSLTLKADGSLVYKPEANYYGKDSFTYKTNDGLVDSATATVNLTVFPVNDAPTLSGIPAALTVDELTPLTLTAKGNDIDTPASSLRYSLTGAPDGATINPSSGKLIWTPSEAQGPGNFAFQINVSDGQLSASAPVSVTVREVNAAPQILNIPAAALAIKELEPYSLTIKGSDSDIPVQSLTYSLTNAPHGATINPNSGVINWTPDETQGPADYSMTVSVTDNGTPSLSDTKTLKIHVDEVNTAPTLSPIGNQTINEETNLTLKLNAVDADLPANTLKYSLLNAPTGATLDAASGVFNWTPTEAQGPGTYSLTFRVTDNGSPALSADQTITITVNEVNTAPKLNLLGKQTINEETNLNFRVNAVDADLPANTLRYSMTNAPAGANLDSANGVFNWIPTEAQGPGTYSVTFRVTDNGTPALSAEQTIAITVNEVNKPPAANDASVNTDEDTTLAIALTASDPDLPANTLSYVIVSQTAHGRLSGTGQNLTYTPNPDFNGSDSFTFKAFDGSLSSNPATITITVKPVNDAPRTQPDSAVTEQNTPVTIDVVANDSDVDGDRITLAKVSNAVGGKVEIVSGKAVFTPNNGFSGAGSFNYTISDGNGGTATGSVTVTIKPIPPKP